MRIVHLLIQQLKFKMKLKRIQLNDSVFIRIFFNFPPISSMCEWMVSFDFNFWSNSSTKLIHFDYETAWWASEHSRWLCFTWKKKLFDRMRISSKQNLWNYKKYAAKIFVWFIITHTSPFREQSLVNFDSDAAATNRIPKNRFVWF